MAGNSYAGTVYGKDGSILYNTGAGLWGGSMTISDVLGLSWNSSGEVTELSKTAGGTALNPSTTLDDLNMATIELYDVTLGPGCHRENDYSAMRGPCDEGFHIPLAEEREALFDIGYSLGAWDEEDGDGISTYLKMPYTGYLEYSDSTLHNVGGRASYWSASLIDIDVASCFYFDSSLVSYDFQACAADGYPIRPFKDIPVIPDSSWSELFDGIYHNATLGLISISEDDTNWITIADKNLGATVVYDNGDTLSGDNCGNYFQRGNCYGFTFEDALDYNIDTSSTQIDTGRYGPNNYFYNDVFVTFSCNRSTTENADLRGGETGVIKKEVCSTYTPHGHIGTRHMEWVPGENDYSAMRGPCDEGYHVPMSSEWQSVYNAGVTIGAWTSSGGNNLSSYLKLPFAGGRNYSTSGIVNQGSNGLYWSSSRNSGSSAYDVLFNSSTIYPQFNNLRALGASVRPFKDVPVEPALPEAVAGPMSSGAIAPSSQGTTLSLWTATENCTCIVSGSLWSGGPGGVTYADLYKNGTRVDSKNSGFISGSVSFEMQVEVSSGDVLTLQTSRGSSSSGAVNNVYVSISNGWSTLYDGSSTATGAGIYHNATLGLISLSSDGQTWITIADKNLGATTVYNSGDTLSEANCGKYFQWGNNYGFPWTGSVTTSSTQVDASTYGPGNYYSSSTFITYGGRRDTTDNGNLRGGVTGVVPTGHYQRRTY